MILFFKLDRDDIENNDHTEIVEELEKIKNRYDDHSIQKMFNKKFDYRPDFQAIHS